MAGKAAAPPIRFGLAALPAMLVEKSGQVLTVSAVKSILDDMETLPEMDDFDVLSIDKHFLFARESVELSKKATTEAEKQKYLEQAIKAYRRAAAKQAAQNDYLAAASCWMNAARCAKENKADQGVVDRMCENAGIAFETSREEILKERTELMKPYKLGTLVRLLFSSPISALLATIYRYSRPNSSTSQTARTYLIKMSFGQDELARIQKNENSAKRFNNHSKTLLNVISELHSNRTWTFDEDQAIPVEVLLSKSYTDLLKGAGVVKQTVQGALVPYMPKDPENMA